ncbi:MAG: hypothetical protein U1D69_06775, partial [Polynucleobacter sp.]|nr:hypothetical protein [Polynucleobacter sp.]
CVRIAKANPIAIWAPLFWFRLASAVYFGFGSLVPYILGDEALSSITSVYDFDSRTHLKVNSIVAFGTLCCLFFTHPFLRSSRRSARMVPVAHTAVGGSLMSCAWMFLLIGGSMRYAIVLPYELGVSVYQVPGIIIAVSNLYYVGIFLLVRRWATAGGRLLPVALILVLSDMLISILMFSKSQLMQIMIFSLLGLVVRTFSKRLVIFGSVSIFTIFVMFGSLVTYGREQIQLVHGRITGATLEERLLIVRNYLDDDSSSFGGLQPSLARLSYVNVNSFVVDRFDSGMPGETLHSAASVIVPRVIWPNKPSISQLGNDLSYEVFGLRGSSLGVGHYAEAYWNFGWFGILPFMFVLATILSVATRVSLQIVEQRNWLFMPVAFACVNIGIRVDGHFVPDTLGSAWIAVVIWGTLRFMQKVLRGVRQQRHIPAVSAYGVKS